jgi:aspartate 1-decarboxylase
MAGMDSGSLASAGPGPARKHGVVLTLCKSKLHRAVVTEANLHYMGSITIDAALMEAADILPFERVQVVDVANGARFETYVVEGRADSGTICLNGAAARLVHVGDPVIIITYAQMTREEAGTHRPTIVLLNPDNTVRETLRPTSGAELAGRAEAYDA